MSSVVTYWFRYDESLAVLPDNISIFDDVVGRCCKDAHSEDNVPQFASLIAISSLNDKARTGVCVIVELNDDDDIASSYS